MFGRQAHRNIQNTHIFTSSFSFIHGYVERNIVLRKRINAYRALASPSLIALSSKVVEIFQSNVVGDVDIYIGGGVYKSSLVHLLLLKLMLNIVQDPILTAFELSWELRRLAFSEHEFKSEYLVGTDVDEGIEDYC